jgi:hydrogenase maturation protease
MTGPRLLIAGVGNIFLGDDAFGCEVVRRLMQRSWPKTVKIVDYGIRGLDLAYALMDDYHTVILVDATPQGSVPGTIYVMELNLDDAGSSTAFVDAHSMHPLNVLRMVRTLGGSSARILLVGCEPAELGNETDCTFGLSERVRAGVEEAIAVVEAFVSEFFSSAPDKQPVISVSGDEGRHDCR